MGRVGLCAFLGALVGTALFLIVATVWSGSPIQGAIVSAHGSIFHQEVVLSPEELGLVKTLESKGALISSNDLFGRVVSYYESVITILTTIIGIFAIVSYIYIKSTNQEQFKQEIERQVNEKLEAKFESSAFVEEIEEMVEELSGAKINADLDLIKRRLDVLANRIAQLDVTEGAPPPVPDPQLG